MRDEPAFQLKRVLAAVNRGETDQFRLIVREYGLLVRGYLSARLAHQDDADDLAQEVFLIAYAKIGSCDPATFVAWLLGIARNQLRNYWRSRARREDALARFREEISEIVEPDLDAVAGRFSPVEIERLLHCISLLPDRLRRIVRAGLEGIRSEVVAQELGINTNALYQSRYRAHTALRRCMSRFGGPAPPLSRLPDEC